MMHKTTIFAAALALAATAAPATARTALKDDPTIENGLVMVAVGKMLRDSCKDISPRYVQAYTFAKSLETRARKLGYSRDEIDAYLKSKADKERVKGKARAWLAARGARPGDTASLCAAGRAEIATGALGRFMQVN